MQQQLGYQDGKQLVVVHIQHGLGGFYQHSRLDKLQRLRDATMDAGEVHVNPHTGLTDQGMAIGPNGICPRMDD